MRFEILNYAKQERAMERKSERREKVIEIERINKLHPLAKILSPYIKDWVVNKGRRKTYKNYFYKVYFSDMMPKPKSNDDNEEYDF